MRAAQLRAHVQHVYYALLTVAPRGLMCQLWPYLTRAKAAGFRALPHGIASCCLKDQHCDAAGLSAAAGLCHLITFQVNHFLFLFVKCPFHCWQVRQQPLPAPRPKP